MQMGNRINARTVTVATGLMLEAWALYVVGASPEHWRPGMIVKDEPAAHALYEGMVEAMRRAQSLSYESACSGPDERTSNFLISLKKPGYVRVETTNGPSNKVSTLVGDGEQLWVSWSGDRPFLPLDDASSYEKTRSNVYVKKAVVTGRDSIAEEIGLLGIAWFGTIIDPSIFHGHTDPFEPYIDGIRARGADKVGDELCDVIEVSLMKAQRTRYLWISRRDHLPRKAKEIVRLRDNRITVEEWSAVTVNAGMPQKAFTWSPPQGSRQWRPPRQEDSLLTNGMEAPDFELPSGRKGTIRLSDYRGKVVWLYMWQAGSPRCREEMPQLQSLYEKYKESGPVVLGLNAVDDKRIAQFFMRTNALTFPNVFDSSAATRKVLSEDYRNKTGDLPLSCIVDSQGTVVDTWYGYDHNRALEALKKAGLP